MQPTKHELMHRHNGDIATKQRQLADDYMSNSDMQRFNAANAVAQQSDQKAVSLESDAVKLQQQATELEQQAANLADKENKLNQQHQAEIDSLVQQQQSLRG